MWPFSKKVVSPLRAEFQYLKAEAELDKVNNEVDRIVGICRREAGAGYDSALVKVYGNERFGDEVRRRLRELGLTVSLCFMFDDPTHPGLCSARGEFTVFWD